MTTVVGVVGSDESDDFFHQNRKNKKTDYGGPLVLVLVTFVTFPVLLLAPSQPALSFNG
jgi:hypothetical protein